jgi:hemolysin activation/secretion protein
MKPAPVIALVWLLAGAVSSSAASAPAARPPLAVELIDGRTGATYVPPSPEALQARLAPLLAAEPTPETLERLVDAVLTHARDHDRPVMEVEADVPVGAHGTAPTSRTVRLVVWPGVVSSLSLEGGAPWARAVIADDWARRTGAELDLGTLEKWLDWTHRNPFHQVTVSFEPGDEPATADGLITLHSDTVARTFVTWRDDGVEPLGPQRFSAGIEVGDLAGAPIWFAGEFIGGEDWPDYRSARGQLRWFLPWHHEARLSGSWTTAELDGFLPGLPITSSLDSVELNPRYVVPLGKWAGWWIDAGAGFDFRRTESGVSVDGVTDRGEGDTAQWVGEVTARRVGEAGEAAATLSGFWSPGGLTAYNDTEDVEVLRPGAEAEYAGVRGEAVARWELPGGWAVVGRGAAQWTSAPPMPTVQLPVSGANAVRGFDEAVVLADVGVWGGVELQAPAWSVPRLRTSATVVPLVFTDAGWARDEALGDETTLASAGIGVRVRGGRQVGLAFDYGWRLTDPGGRAHFALVVSF